MVNSKEFVEIGMKTKKCQQCGHPTPDSVVDYKAVQELARIRAEEERKRRKEERSPRHSNARPSPFGNTQSLLAHPMPMRATGK